MSTSSSPNIDMYFVSANFPMLMSDCFVILGIILIVLADSFTL